MLMSFVGRRWHLLHDHHEWFWIEIRRVGSVSDFPTSREKRKKKHRPLEQVAVFCALKWIDSPYYSDGMYRSGSERAASKINVIVASRQEEKAAEGCS